MKLNSSNFLIIEPLLNVSLKLMMWVSTIFSRPKCVPFTKMVDVISSSLLKVFSALIVRAMSSLIFGGLSTQEPLPKNDYK